MRHHTFLLLLSQLMRLGQTSVENGVLSPKNGGPVSWQNFPVHDRSVIADVRDFPSSVVYNDSVVQALHLSLYDDKSIVATWLKPTKYNPRSVAPICKFTADGVKYHETPGRSYSYSAGCFDSTLNAVIMDVTKVSSDVYKKITYRCGDPTFGLSQWYSFRREKPNVGQEASETAHDGEEILVAERLRSGKVSVDFTFEATVENQKERKRSLGFLFGSNNIAIIGDISSPAGDDTIATLNRLAADDSIKLLIHAGDISYADDYDRFGEPINNSYILTDYMNKVADVTTKIPYMPAPGNHEVQFNFAAYKNWFNVPYQQSRSTSQLWYSFDYMGVHFLSYNSEEDFSQGSAQNDWIQADLQRANANRERVPWILMYAHRPLYCTCSQLYTYYRCSYQAKFYREYLEEILHEAKVDVHVAGHNHGYERSYPVYHMQATSYHFNNPTSTVYIVNGNAGNVEIKNNVFLSDISWRAHCNTNMNNGMLLMEPSRGQLKFVYFDTTLQEVTDGFTITKG